MPDGEKTAIRNRLAALATKQGVSLRSLSARLGRGPSYLNDFVRKGSPDTLEMKDALTLARILEVRPSELGVEENLVDISRQSVASPSKPSLTFDFRERPALQKDLPIRGHARAGQLGLFIDQGNHWGYAMRPESLRDVKEAYAVRVVDESMYPRYAPGNVLQVDPHRRPQPGDNVVIQIGEEGEAVIKELVRRTEKNVICKQFNPPEILEYKTAQVRAIHMVVGIDYLER
jgi:phage repressor protein C with HTH and peptisase S24 domain